MSRTNLKSYISVSPSDRSSNKQTSKNTSMNIDNFHISKIRITNLENRKRLDNFVENIIKFHFKVATLKDNSFVPYLTKKFDIKSIKPTPYQIHEKIKSHNRKIIFDNEKSNLNHNNSVFTKFNRNANSAKLLINNLKSISCANINKSNTPLLKIVQIKKVNSDKKGSRTLSGYKYMNYFTPTRRVNSRQLNDNNNQNFFSSLNNNNNRADINKIIKPNKKRISSTIRSDVGQIIDFQSQNIKYSTINDIFTKNWKNFIMSKKKLNRTSSYNNMRIVDM